MLFQPQSGNLPYPCFGLRRMAVQPRERQRSAGACASFETSRSKEDSTWFYHLRCCAVSKPPVEGVIPLLCMAFVVDVVSSAKGNQMTIFRSNRITWHELVGVHWWHHISDDYKHFHFYPLSVWLHAMSHLWILSGNWSARTDRRRKGKEWLFKRQRWLGLARVHPCGQNHWLTKYLLILRSTFWGQISLWRDCHYS